jgi:hypothetical protein
MPPPLFLARMSHVHPYAHLLHKLLSLPLSPSRLAPSPSLSFFLSVSLARVRALSLRPPFPSFISSCSQGVRRHLSVLNEAQCYSHAVRHHMSVLNNAQSCMSRMSGLVLLIQTHTREHTHSLTHTQHTRAYTQTRRGKRRENLVLGLTIF